MTGEIGERRQGAESRQSGIEPVGAVPWGTHFCQFYQTADDLVETLVPYFRAGLEANELCLWVASAPLGVEAATAALRAALPAADAFLASGQVEILDYRQWYLRSGRFEAQPVLEAWVERLAGARRRGLDGLRLSANTFWLEEASWRDFTAYEEAVDGVIGRHRMIALCTYSLERCGVREILDVVANHEFALIKRAGRWELIEQLEHGRTEQALRDSEARYRGLFEGMTEGFALHEVLLDEEGRPHDYRFLEVNPAFERQTGLGRDAVLGRTVREVLPGIEPAWVEVYGRVALTGEPAQFEDHSAPLGRTFEVRAYSPRRGQFAVLFTDVTERRRTEEKLSWLASFPELNPNPVAELDLGAGAVSYANPSSRVRLPGLVDEGPSHPWFRGAAELVAAARAEGAAAAVREVEVEGAWWRQTVTLAGSGRRLRTYGVEITDRVAAEREVEAARVEAVTERNRLEAVLEALPVGVAIVDSAGGNVRTNRAYEELWGGPRPLPRSVDDYGTYRAWWAASGQPVEPREWASALAVQRGETVVGQLLEIERFDGTRALVHNSAAPFHGAGGEIAGSAVAVLDVTEMRRTERELARLGERLGRAQRAAGAGTWEWDLETGRLEWSPELFRLLGLDPDSAEASFEAWRGAIHPADRALAEERVEVALRDRTPLESEYRVLFPGGQVRWVAALGDTIVGEGGAVRRMAGIIVDVTRRKEAEDAVRASEERFHALAAALPQIVWTAAADGGVEWLNHRWYDFVGPDARGEGWAWRDLVHPDDLPVVLERWQHSLREGQVFEGELRLRRHDGEMRWFLVRAWPMRDARGSVLRWFGTHTDVHDLKEAERAVRESREDLSRAQAVSHTGSWRLDVRRNELRWSEEGWRIFGVPRGTPLTYETFLGTVHPDDRDHVHAAWMAALRGEPCDVEHRIVVGGAVRWVRERAELEVDADGELVGGFGTTQDVTERREAEALLRAALCEKEVLLREIHHRVKNNLQIIASLLNLQLAGIADERLRAPLVESQNRVRTLALIHEKLYGSSDLTGIAAGSYLAELVQAVRRSFGPVAGAVRLELDLEEVELEVGVAMPVALIANELVANAFKHAFPGGRPGRLAVRLHRLGEGRCALEVDDDGVGLPPGLDVERTTTLGLQLVTTLATQLRGSFEVHRGQGTRFVLEFAVGA